MTDREINLLWWNVIGYALTAGASVLLLVGFSLFVPAVRRRWLPLSRLRPGRWAGHEVFLSFCTVLGAPTLVLSLLLGIGFFSPLIGPPPAAGAPLKAQAMYTLQAGTISSPLGLAVTLGILFAILFARSGCRPHHLGLSWARWPQNVALGLAAAVVATPVVLGVNFLATRILGENPHAITQLGQMDLPDWEWFFVAFSVTAAAPWLEETLFRGVLLGWLRRATLAGHLGVLSATILAAVAYSWLEDSDGKTIVFNAGPLIFALLLAAGYGYLMFRLARKFTLTEREIQEWRPQARRDGPKPSSPGSTEDAGLRRWQDANARLAVYGSAMLFALFHGANWPGPIALFLFALAAGELARRTQSLIGPITLHAAFNLVAFISLFGSTHYDIAPKGRHEITAARPSVLGSITTSVPASQLPRRK